MVIEVFTNTRSAFRGESWRGGLREKVARVPQRKGKFIHWLGELPAATFNWTVHAALRKVDSPLVHTHEERGGTHRSL